MEPKEILERYLFFLLIVCPFCFGFLILPFILLISEGRGLYNTVDLEDSGTMEEGKDEEERLYARTKMLILFRVVAAFYSILGIVFLCLIVRDGLDLSGLRRTAFDAAGIAASVYTAYICLVRPDTKSFLRVDLPTKRPYTVNNLHIILRNSGTTFGTPGVAWVWEHGRVLLYGPTDSGVYVFVVPSPLHRRISVRLMAAPCRIWKYEEPFPRCSPEINSRLNDAAEKTDYHALLGPMAAEIARRLNEDADNL